MSSVAVQLDNELTFDADRDRVWALMTDVPRVVPCIPGGRLLETVDDSNWKAEVALDLGFTRVVFLADVARTELDPAASRATLRIDAVDAKGRSTAQATMTSALGPAEVGTEVKVSTELKMQGDVARFGSGIIEDVSCEIVDQMTKCLQARLAEGEGETEGGAPGAAAATARKLTPWAALMLWVRGRRRRRARRGA